MRFDPLRDPSSPSPTPMTSLKTICVYCGSGPGADPAFLDAARTLGREMAEQGVGLVYGGGNIGLQMDGASVNTGRFGQGLNTNVAINPDMVDEMRVSSDERHHRIELIMHLEGASNAGENA